MLKFKVFENIMKRIEIGQTRWLEKKLNLKIFNFSVPKSIASSLGT